MPSILISSLAHLSADCCANFFHDGEEVGAVDAVTLTLGVEESVDAVLLLGGVLVLRLEGNLSCL